MPNLNNGEINENLDDDTRSKVCTGISGEGSLVKIPFVNTLGIEADGDSHSASDSKTDIMIMPSQCKFSPTGPGIR